MRKVLFVLLRALVKVSAALYEADGVNIPLMFMPTQLIAPLLQEYGAQIGSYVRFRAPLTIHNAALNPGPFYHNLNIGNNCFFGRELFLDLQDRMVIEDNVTVSHRVMILTHTDVGESPLKENLFPPSQAPVTIRQGAYIGGGVIILPGVEIGECAVVGAGAVVTRDVPPRTVVAGVPAQVIKSLDRKVA
jgi:acetyltransferase-like isoleucine patch superfamily enzyme